MYTLRIKKKKKYNTILQDKFTLFCFKSDIQVERIFYHMIMIEYFNIKTKTN